MPPRSCQRSPPHHRARFCSTMSGLKPAEPRAESISLQTHIEDALGGAVFIQWRTHKLCISTSQAKALEQTSRRGAPGRSRWIVAGSSDGYLPYPCTTLDSPCIGLARRRCSHRRWAIPRFLSPRTGARSVSSLGLTVLLDPVPLAWVS
jgi:hypothetical protein